MDVYFVVCFRFDMSFSGTISSPCLLDSEARAKRLEAEAKAEVNLKSRDFTWLQTTGRNIVDTSPPRAGATVDVETRLDVVTALWERLNSLASIRAEKRARLAQTKDELSKRLEELRVWLSGIETALEAPLVLERGSKKAVDKLLKEYEGLQRRVETQSGNVGEVLNLCELLLQDPTVDSLGVDTGEFAAAVQAIERR